MSEETTDSASASSRMARPQARSTQKKDSAPRGVFRHRSGVWAVRFTCGAGTCRSKAARFSSTLM